MRFIILFLYVAFLPDAIAHSYHSDATKKVYFITPSDGTTVTNPVKIKFGATGVNIVPAGVDMPDSGHHHLLINVDKLPNLKLPNNCQEYYYLYCKFCLIKKQKPPQLRRGLRVVPTGLEPVTL